MALLATEISATALENHFCRKACARSCKSWTRRFSFSILKTKTCVARLSRGASHRPAPKSTRTNGIRSTVCSTRTRAKWTCSKGQPSHSSLDYSTVSTRLSLLMAYVSPFHSLPPKSHRSVSGDWLWQNPYHQRH